MSLKGMLGPMSFSTQAPAGTGVSREAVSGLLIMGAGGASLIVLSMLLLRRKKPYGAISHGVVEVRARSLLWVWTDPVLSAARPQPQPPSTPAAGGPHAEPGGTAAAGTAAAWL